MSVWLERAEIRPAPKGPPIGERYLPSMASDPADPTAGLSKAYLYVLPVVR